MRVLFTGSKDLPRAYLPDIEEIVRALPTGTTCVHGGCLSGLDAHLHLLFLLGHLRDYIEEVHPAVWYSYPDGKYRYHPDGGLRRNSHMVSLGADLCIGVYYGGKTPGTSDCVEKARTAGIEVHEVAFPYVNVRGV